MLNIDLLVMNHEEIMLKIASNTEKRRRQYKTYTEATVRESWCLILLI